MTGPSISDATPHPLVRPTTSIPPSAFVAHPRLLTAAAHGGLRPPPARRLRRATGPNARLLHLLHGTAFRIWVFYIQPPSTFVAHQRTRTSASVFLCRRVLLSVG